MNLTRNDALSFNLNASFRENHAIETPGNHHPVALDLSFNLRAFAQNHGLFGDDVPFYVAVDAERAGDSQCPVEGHALINETRPFFLCVLFFVTPGHFHAMTTPRRDSPHSNRLCRQVNEALWCSCRIR